jgi:hypothetical protein
LSAEDHALNRALLLAVLMAFAERDGRWTLAAMA